MTSIGRATRSEVPAYDVSSLAGERFGTVPSGSNVLIAGPSMTGKSELALNVLAPRGKHKAVLVTSDQPAARILDRIEGLEGAVDTESVCVVDCSGSASRGSFGETAGVKHVSSPSDLTGVGMGIAKCTNEIGTAARDGLGLGVLSLSTLLQYSSERRVFNFVHVMTGRVAAADYLGIWTVDTTSHDEQTVNTIRGQFDYVAEVRDTESGERELRMLGGENDWRTWEAI